MSRNLLHKDKLDTFKQWLDAKGIQHRSGRGDWQLLQVLYDGKTWACIYDRYSVLEHLTADHRLDSLVRRFIKDTNPKHPAGATK
jgi:hypothetical protein